MGWASAALAAAMVLGGTGQANAPTRVQPTVTSTAPAPQASSAPQAASAQTAQPAPAPAAAPPADPLLAVDGGPAVAIDPKIGQPVEGRIGTQPQVTPNGEFAAWMHNDLLVPIITLISLFVLGLLLYAMVRYRHAANPVASKTSHNTLIEVIWTAVPIVILVVIAVPSIGLLQAQFKPAPANAVTLKAIGNQWYWSYQYPDHGGFEITSNMLKEKGEVAAGERARTDVDGPRLLATDNRVVLPVNTPIRLITTANDVIHSWAMPAFWVKLDAVPGKLNETSFTIKRPGVYFGQCSELCGARHGYMPITVVAVDRATFDRWVVAKGGTLPGAAPAAASDAAADAAAAPAAGAAPSPAPMPATPLSNETSPVNTTAPAADK